MTVEEDYPYRLGFCRALLREARAHLRRDAKDMRKAIDDFLDSEAELREARGHEYGRKVPQMGATDQPTSPTATNTEPGGEGPKPRQSG